MLQKGSRALGSILVTFTSQNNSNLQLARRRKWGRRVNSARGCWAFAEKASFYKRWKPSLPKKP
ncbi:unnamed protein product [Prunus armeniaca]